MRCLAEPHLHFETARWIDLDRTLVTKRVWAVVRSRHDPRSGDAHCGIRHAPRDRRVRLFDARTLFEFTLEGPIAIGRFGDEQDAARLTIDPMA